MATGDFYDDEPTATPDEYPPDSVDSPPVVLYRMPAATYHLDAGGPRLSQSLATLCCVQSPLHAWAAHPLLGRGSIDYEPSTDAGTIMHSLILEPDSKAIQEIDGSTIRTQDGSIAKSPMGTTEGKRIRDDALAAGKIPILSEALGAYKYKATALRQRFADVGVEFCGYSEVVICWTEQTPSGPVRCRCRLDHLIITLERIRIIDLKTCDSAHANEAKLVAWRKGYDIQGASYTRAVTTAFPAYAGRVDFVLAFAELEKPYAVNAVTLDAEFQRIGDLRWERGRDRWARALAEDEWRGYEGGSIGVPAWAAAEEMGES